MDASAVNKGAASMPTFVAPLSEEALASTVAPIASWKVEPVSAFVLTTSRVGTPTSTTVAAGTSDTALVSRPVSPAASPVVMIAASVWVFPAPPPPPPIFLPAPPADMPASMPELPATASVPPTDAFVSARAGFTSTESPLVSTLPASAPPPSTAPSVFLVVLWPQPVMAMSAVRKVALASAENVSRLISFFIVNLRAKSAIARAKGVIRE